MSHDYSKRRNSKVTPQSQKIPGREKEMVANNAGGFTFKVDEWDALMRFLILGTAGGTYYVSENKLTDQNIDNLIAVIKKDPKRVLETVVEVSDAGRAPKNDPAIFVLALLMVHAPAEYKKEIVKALPKVCRIGTHLFTWVHYVDTMRSWGRAVRKAIANWYSMPADKLEYQIVKYQGRTVEGTGNKWTHRDVLRSAHVKPESKVHDHLFRYAVKGDIVKTEKGLIDAVEILKKEENIQKACDLISQYNIPQEAWPTELKNEPAIWEAALPKMPVTATMRNLGKLTSIGVLGVGRSSYDNIIVDRLTDPEILKRGRVHPMSILIASRTYSAGHGFRGKLSWNPSTRIIDALDEAFYASFGNVIPTGKRTLIALDVSGSMTWEVLGNPITCRDASAAMSLITMRTEKNYEVVGFTSNRGGGWGRHAELTHLNISPRQRLDDVIENISNLPFGGTDCALPMVWATDNNLEFDTFIVYTDNETWAGDIQPSQALKKYRNKTGIPARLIVAGMACTGFTIADPKDKGMLDIVGFDSSAPNIISDFSRGDI